MHQRLLKWRVLLLLLVSAAVAATPVAAEVRQSQVADQFYPGDQAELLELVEYLLKRQPEAALTTKPRILIVPHAGYQYSGLVAANGFRTLPGRHYDRVVVVGFTHQAQFSGSSVDTAEAFRTPLGEIPIDQEAVAVLQTYPGIRYLREAHEGGEHSMEVELPFLQDTLGRFRLVPVLMGSATLRDAEQLAEALTGLARVGDTLFVFSSDLSHYHPYDEALKRDERTISAILQETPQAVDRLFSAGELEACGRGPIVTSLLLAQKLGFLSRQLLFAANSGDTFGNPSKVVGYASIAMFDAPTPSTGRLSAKAGEALVRAARQMLMIGLAKRDVPHPQEALKRYPELSRARGAFVTLRKHGQLRGCIGHVQTTEPLTKTIPEVALSAALRDPRFPPVAAGELQEIDIEVSVLTRPRPLGDLKELVPGRDGVILEYQGRSGVFLPQVWEETGWTREEFLQELSSQKADLPPDAWQRATLSTFQAQVFSESP
ncbi:MAG: AmmeMemoRadiSam system protein B [Candidatus Omnitrophica bacterium]|nr:AmmeMemoRadiSam system protein B [Candidatus Omnitrophota bacterium]